MQDSCNKVNTNTVGIQSSRKWVSCGDKRIMSITANHSIPNCNSCRLTKGLNRKVLLFQIHLRPTHIIRKVSKIAVWCGTQQRYGQSTSETRKERGRWGGGRGSAHERLLRMKFLKRWVGVYRKTRRRGILVEWTSKSKCSEFLQVFLYRF